MERQNNDNSVWVTVTRTIATGNFENIKIEAGMQASPKKADTQPELLEELCDTVWDIVYHKSKQYKKAVSPKKKIRNRDDEDDDPNYDNH